MALDLGFCCSLLWCLGDEQENLDYHTTCDCPVTCQESLANYEYLHCDLERVTGAASIKMK
jgi:hypothetical protein